MKKIFKRIAILVCVVLLLSVPGTAFASTSNLRLIVSTPNCRVYQYLPDPLDLKVVGGFAELGDVFNPNYDDYDWHVSAGQKFEFVCYLRQSCTFNYLITVNGVAVALQNNVYSDSIIYNSPVLSSNAKIEVFIWADSTSPVYIDTYSGQVN